MHSKELLIHLNILPETFYFNHGQKFSSFKNEKTTLKDISASCSNAKHLGKKFPLKKQLYSLYQTQNKFIPASLEITE